MMFNSLKTKLMLSMMSLVTLVIILISYSIIKNQQQAAQEQAYDELSSLSQLIATNSISAVVFNDPVAAEETLSGLKSRSDLLSAVIFDSAGRLFSRYHREQKMDLPDLAMVENLLKQNHAHIHMTDRGMYCYMPMISDGETVGLVYLEDDLSSLKSELNHFYQVVILTSVVAFIISFALMLLLQTMFSRPLHQLLNVIHNITDTKNYGQRAPMGNTSEFNALAESFNTMLAEVEERGQQLQTINAELEQRILQRTEELESALSLANEGNRAQTEFIAMMSHEVRTPLNGIIGFSELLKTYDFDKDIKDIVYMLHDSSQDLLSLLNEVLDFSKLEANKVELEMRPFDLEQFMQSIMETFRPLADKNDLTLKLELNQQTGRHYLGDSMRLRQVLNNLINNAIKFTPQGQVTVVVDSEAIGSEVILSFHVIDTGIGIDNDALESLFSPFTQADSSITRQYGGTGLGLAICKQLVELMQGSFGVDSGREVGSDFWFKIPVNTVNVLKEDELKTTPLLANSHAVSARILVAEDNPVNQLIVKSLLGTFGHECDVVNNGQEAVDKAFEHQYDVIFMDYHMPGMDGIAATKMIREQVEEGLNKTTPIIALTADTQPQVSKTFRRAGANDVLIKPFTRINLAQLLAKWLPIEIAVSESTETGVSETLPHDEGKTLLDTTVLDDILAMSVDGSTDIVRQVITIYLQTCPKLMQKMHQAFDEGDHTALFKDAHALKSSSANVGAVSMAELAKEIESDSRLGQLNKTDVLLANMEQYYVETKLALDKKMTEYG